MRAAPLALVLIGCTGTLASVSSGEGDAGAADLGPPIGRPPAMDLGAVDTGTPPPDDMGVPPEDMGPDLPPPPPDMGIDLGPPPPVGGLVSDLRVTGLAAFQSVRVALVEDGALVSDRNAPLIAGKELLVRAYVAPGDDWEPREVTARLDVLDAGELLASYEARRTPRGESDEEDDDTVFSFFVAPENVTEGAQLRVALTDPNDGTPEETAGMDDARYPRDGSSFALGAVGNGGLDFVVVPVQYDADGSGREPVLVEDSVNALRAHMLAMFPVAEDQLRLSVREPYASDTTISRSGSGFDTLLEEIRQLRLDDGVSRETYYYGAVTPADNFAAYCNRSCVTGLGFVSDVRVASTRVSVGVWFGGEGSRLTLLHELGHTLGRPHAPCGTGGERAFPHAGGIIGVVGFDTRTDTLYPASYTDLMGYCDDQWISDYNVRQVHDRFVAVTGPTPLSWAPPEAHHVFRDTVAGVGYGGRVFERPAGATSPDRVLAEALDGLGRSLGFVAAHEVELSDHRGHHYLVPEVEGAASYTVGGTRFDVPGAR
ncbi:MAG: hypothetical protein AAGH15_17930 [Myxococcota bacterium]